MELGTTVTLTYRGTLDDGTVFGVATRDEPMVFQTGMEMAIDGLENEILQMNEVGEKRSFKIGMYDAYGEYIEDLTETIPLENIPFDVAVGKRVWIANDDGGSQPVTVLEITDSEVIFDFNHPLAGQDLNFEVEILALEAAPENFISAKEKRKAQSRFMSDMGINSNSMVL